MRLYVFENYRKSNGEEVLFDGENKACAHGNDAWYSLTSCEKQHYIMDQDAIFRVYGIDIPSETLDAYKAGEGVNLYDYEIDGDGFDILDYWRKRKNAGEKVNACIEMLDDLFGFGHTPDDVAKAWEHDYFTDHEIDGETYIWYMDPDGVEAACDECGNSVDPAWIAENVIR